jgi:hypothetical protein
MLHCIMEVLIVDDTEAFSLYKRNILSQRC